MKYSLSIVFLLLVNIVFGQNSTTVKQADSLVRAVVQYTPYYSQPWATAGNYVQPMNDSNLYKFNQGISIYNFLRGRVPGLVIDPYAVLSTPGFRSLYYTGQAATVLIDGVPYNSAIGSYLNMNAWEYSAMTVSPTTNALAYLDLPSNGVISLISKGGEGHNKPTLEFNSTPIVGVRDQQVLTPSGSTTTTYKDWHFNNAIAFMQDFGAMDVRVSYNALKPWVTPSQSRVKSPMSHYLNVNLGYKLGRKGEVRLITGGTLRPQAGNYTREVSTFPATPADTGRIESKLKFLNINVTARYQLTNWLLLSAQATLSAQDSSYAWESSAFGTRTTEKRDGHRRANLFFSVNRRLSEKFDLNGFVGMQYTYLKTQRTQTVESNSADFDLSFDRTYVSGGTTIAYNSFASTTALVKLPVSENDYANYSVSSAFIFSKFLNWPVLSIGKLRGTIGKNHFTDYSSYPYQRFRYSSSSGKTTPITSIEWGADIGLFKDRLELHFSRFNDRWETGYTYLPEFYQKGVESIVKYNLIQRRTSILKAQLVTAWIDGDDFRGSFLVDYSYRNIFISLMAERISLESTFPSQSFTRMRDATLGVSLQPTWLNRLKIHAVQASLSARNFYDFGGDGRNDFEGVFFDFHKSYMSSLTIRF